MRTDVAMCRMRSTGESLFPKPIRKIVKPNHKTGWHQSCIIYTRSQARSVDSTQFIEHNCAFKTLFPFFTSTLTIKTAVEQRLDFMQLYNSQKNKCHSYALLIPIQNSFH